MVNDNGVASSTLAKGPADLLAELGRIISSEDLKNCVLASSKCIEGKERLLTHNEVVKSLVGLAPCRHDEGVVEGNHDNLVDTLSLELGDLGGEAGDVVGLAGRGEGTGYGDEDDLLILELCSIVKRRLLSKGEESRSLPLLALYLVGRPQAVMSLLSGEGGM